MLLWVERSADFRISGLVMLRMLMPLLGKKKKKHEEQHHVVLHSVLVMLSLKSREHISATLKMDISWVIVLKYLYCSKSVSKLFLSCDIVNITKSF